MQGIITLKSGKFIFRDDHAHGDKIWAWEIHGDFDRATVHKWEKIPNNPLDIQIFDLENPPQTIPFQPLLN